jgi:serine/threonine-protein kinase
MFLQAREILPEGVESFYQKALGLVAQERYQEAIDFIEHEIDVNSQLENHQVRMVSIYHLLAESYFRIGDYSGAVRVYERSLEIGGSQNMTIVRDYAIALVRLGETGRALTILNEAITQGMGVDATYYVRGEIAYVEGDLHLAIRDFERAITATEDTSLMRRAYLMISRLYEGLENRSREREVLLEGMGAIPPGERLPILQRLVMVNRHLGMETGLITYFEDALEVLGLIVNQYHGTFTDYDNIVVFSMKVGDLDTADETLTTMEERFGEDYQIYKHRANLEILIQEEMAMDQRDYSRFQYYYIRAVELYREQLRDHDGDFRMDLLEIHYQQIREGGWLD